MKLPDDAIPLPGPSPPSRSSKTTTTPWQRRRLAPLLLSTFITLSLSILLFHLRWTRYYGYQIRSAPSDTDNLPIISHVFSPHPELLPFDAPTQEKWESLNLPDWWDTEWRDENTNGETTHRGFHMFHMVHCLGAIRGEFTRLATEPERHVVYNGRDSAATIWRYHLGHCFDFLRQDILCYADPALEPLTHPGYGEPSGFGVEHQCRDWRVLQRHTGQAPSRFTEVRSGK